MDQLTSLKLAELRQQDLRVDAARAQLAAEGSRGRHLRSRLDGLWRIARRRRSHLESAPPATVTTLASGFGRGDLDSQLVAGTPAAAHGERVEFVRVAAARGASPSLLSILADEAQSDVARQRALGRIAVELATSMRDSVEQETGGSDAA